MLLAVAGEAVAGGVGAGAGGTALVSLFELVDDLGSSGGAAPTVEAAGLGCGVSAGAVLRDIVTWSLILSIVR